MHWYAGNAARFELLGSKCRGSHDTECHRHWASFCGRPDVYESKSSRICGYETTQRSRIGPHDTICGVTMEEVLDAIAQMRDGSDA